MSICVSVKVSEGLVFGADSIVVISGQGSGVLNTYMYAQKLTQIGKLPIGSLNWGLSQIGSRSIQSLISEFVKEKRFDLSPQEREKQKTEDFEVKRVATDLHEFLLEKYNDHYGNAPEPHPILGMQVGGYSPSKFFPNQFIFHIPRDKSIIEIREDIDGKPDFGANWFGQTDAITRMYKGFDPRMITDLADRMQVGKNAIEQSIQEMKLEYPVIFDGMPLQDAIDFALWLMNIVIGRFRFVLGAPTCGGDIDIAVIQADGFQWVRRKSWHV